MTRIWFWAYVRPEGLRCDFYDNKRLIKKKKGFVVVAEGTRACPCGVDLSTLVFLSN